MAAALGRWAQDEMGLSPPPERVLRRLCSGSCAPIWDFVTRHIRNPQNVKKIRGNLLWYQHLEEMEGAGPARQGAGLRQALSRLRQEVAALDRALAGAQGAVLRLEEELEAELGRREAGLRRGAELRLLGAGLAQDRAMLSAGRDALQPPPRASRAGPELEAAVAVGAEPDVLASVRAVCRIRAESLEALMEPRPLQETRELTAAANQRWLREAEALLAGLAPAELLWALELLARESTRKLMEPDLALEPDPAPEPEAPPTLEFLIQEAWGTVGELWGRLPPLAAQMLPLRARLADTWGELARNLGGDPQKLRLARQVLELANLQGFRGALTQGVQELRGGPPKTSGPPLGERWHQLRRGNRHLRIRRCRLRALGVSVGGVKRRLRHLRGRAQGEGRPALALWEEGQRLREALGALGALGALWEPPLGPSPHPLEPSCRALGLPPHQDRHWLLGRALSLRRELRGEGPREWGAEPKAAPPPPPLPREGVAEAELLPRLRLVAAQTSRRLQDWPRLQALLSQWWEQPAQWALDPPPAGIPFSHWLQRWSRAAGRLAVLPRPRPLASAIPTQRGEGP